MKKYIARRTWDEHWDVLLRDDNGWTFVAKFASWKDAHMFKRTKNENQKAREYRRRK